MEAFQYPDCPNCCQVRITQGISSVVGTGSLCPSCIYEQSYRAYIQSPEYISWKQTMPEFTTIEEFAGWFAANPAPLFSPPS